jgi:hypothetical protein
VVCRDLAVERGDQAVEPAFADGLVNVFFEHLKCQYRIRGVRGRRVSPRVARRCTDSTQ